MAPDANRIFHYSFRLEIQKMARELLGNFRPESATNLQPVPVYKSEINFERCHRYNDWKRMLTVHLALIEIRFCRRLALSTSRIKKGFFI